MNRRDFLKSSALFAGAAAVPSVLKAEDARTIRVGVIGCGGRGVAKGWGATGNILDAAKAVGCKIEFVAFCDYFKDKADKAAETWNPQAKRFYGANGYKELLALPEVDLVFLTTPLNFRTRHFAAAVAAGKHVFEEKGVAVDPVTVREHLAAAKLAAEKKLTVVTGIQRRHQRGYLLQAKALRDGVVAPVVSGVVRWNGSVPWVHKREPWMTNKDYLCSNWLNFTELSGDHIAEQHAHNIDVANWFIGRYPKKASSFGLRAHRFTGNQYDFFATEFDYGDGVTIMSECRQIDGCTNAVNEQFTCADGAVISGGASIKRGGKKLELAGDFPETDPYVQEHIDLLNSILGKGPYLNDAETCAMSTACAVMARLSAYTGQTVSMNDILKNESSPFYNMNCKPSAADFEAEGDIPMPVLGDGQFALPGTPWRGVKG